jgi:hypothetical protein
MNQEHPSYPGLELPQSQPLPDPIVAMHFEPYPVEKPKTIITDLLDSGSRMVFGGGSKTYKTWAMSDLALSISTGSAWWGFQCSPCPVLYVNFELKVFHCRERFKAIRLAKKLKLEQLGGLWIWNLRDHHISGSGLLEFRKRLIELIAANSIVCVFLDPFYKLLGEADERVTAELMPILALFEDIGKATGATIITAAHFTKGNQAEKDPIDRISGGGGINRHPDVLLMLTKHETDGSFTVDIITRDFAPLQPFVISWHYPLLTPDSALDPTALKRAGTHPGGRPTEYSEEDFLALLSKKDDQLSTGELQRYICAEMGCSRAKFYEIKTKLLAEGKIFQSVQTEKWNAK